MTTTLTVASQADRIIAKLKESGRWVSMPRLARASGSWNVHSRIAQLRAQGFTIENRVERKPGNRSMLSSYRLIQTPDMPDIPQV